MFTGRKKRNVSQHRALLLASFPDSILSFRGELIKAMLASGMEVHVAAPGLDSRLGIGTCLSSMGVVVHDVAFRRSGKSPFEDILLFGRLCMLMHRIRPGLVLAYTIKPVIYGILAASLTGVPKRFALITGLGYSFTSGRRGILISIVWRLYRYSIRRAHKVFFQNPDDRRAFSDAGILSSNTPSVVVNGSGVDLDFFQPMPIPGSPLVFLMIGRLLGDKGVREYVAAATTIRAAFPAIRFCLIGWIDSNPDAISHREMVDWSRSGAIDFLGRLEDVRPAIASCSVYVLPSYREGTPRTVLEAMAMGRPVITTNAPGCRETVIDGDNGFLVPIKSVAALEQAMLRFVENPALAQDMGRRSRKIAEEKYDVHKVNAVMLREMGISN